MSLTGYFTKAGESSLANYLPKPLRQMDPCQTESINAKFKVNDLV